jgi:single-strand DNA-binding protein
MYLNKVILMGNLTRDPELKALPSGIKVCNFSLATNRTWKDANGQRQESVEYHNVVLFGKQAELVSQYMKKGRSIYLEGRLQTRSWDQDGQKRYRTEIMADSFQFGQSAQSGSAPSAPRETGAPLPKQEELETIEYPMGDIDPEDIPF